MPLATASPDSKVVEQGRGRAEEVDESLQLAVSIAERQPAAAGRVGRGSGRVGRLSTGSIAWYNKQAKYLLPT